MEQLGDPAAVRVIDETGFLKKGTESVGVQRQSSGTAGRIGNCRIGAFLAHASPRGRACRDRALYLPQAWIDNPPRREEAGIPLEVPFATKGDLAQTMLARAFAADVPAAWVTGDEVYGNDGDLRRWLEGQQRPDVLAVACSHPVWDGGRQVRIATLVEHIPAEGWVQWLLIRRSVSDPQEIAFYRAFGRKVTPIAGVARVAGARWTIEEGLQRAKTIGLDQYEVRSWQG